MVRRIPLLYQVNHPTKSRLHDLPDITEDFGFAEVLSLSICDGSSGYNFPSNHVAELVCRIFSLTVRKNRYDRKKRIIETWLDDLPDITEEFAEPLDIFFKQLNTEIYNRKKQFVEEEMEKAALNLKGYQYSHGLIKLNALKNIQLHQHFASATSFRGMYLTEKEDGNPKLHIYGAGVLPVVVFNEVQLSGGFIAYNPTILINESPDHLSRQKLITTADFLTMKYKLKKTCTGADVTDKMTRYAYEQKLRSNLQPVVVNNVKDSLVLLGSDGLFSNVPAPFITVLVNYIVKQIEILTEAGQPIPEPNLLVDELVDEYIHYAKQATAFYSILNLNLNKELPVKLDRAVGRNGEQKVHQIDLIEREVNFPYLRNYRMISKTVEEREAENAKYNEYCEDYTIQREIRKGKKAHEIDIGEDDEDLFKTVNFKDNMKIEPNQTELIKIDNTVEQSKGHKFRMRVLMTDLFSNCENVIYKLTQYSSETANDSNVYHVNLDDCLKTVIEGFQIKTNYLKQVGSSIVGKALAAAALKIMNSGITISPEGIKLMRLGVRKEKTSKDDITVISALLTNKSDSDIKDAMETDTSLSNPINNFKADIDLFLQKTLEDFEIQSVEEPKQMKGQKRYEKLR